MNALEDMWPELKPQLKKVRTAKELIPVLEQMKRHSSIADLVQTTPEYAEQLLSFLKSERYSGDPRQIADAMAGYPFISVRRSFDRCRGTPCDMVIGSRAERDYFQRKFPLRFAELLNATSEDEFRHILSKTRSKDRLYKFCSAHPETIAEMLREGLPEQTS